MKKIIKIWPITKQMPEQYEEWLEELELKGWHLTHVSFLGMSHHFIKVEPSKIRYCFDYQDKKKPEYEKIFTDLGWDLANYSCGMYLWRKRYEHERPEAFTDYESIISRNKRYYLTLITCCIPGLMMIISSFGKKINFSTSVGVKLIFLICLYVWVFFIIAKLIIHNMKLKKLYK